MKKRMYLAAALTPLALLLGAKTMAWSNGGSASAQTGAARILANGESRRAATAGTKGATYYALEARASRVTTEFVDGTRAVAERMLDGDVVSSLSNGAVELNRVHVDLGDGTDDVLKYTAPSVAPIQAAVDASTRPTLDWANRQSFHFYQDGVVSSSGLHWVGGGLRRAGAGASTDDEDAPVKSLETTWPNGLSAATHRAAPKPGQLFRGKLIRGPVLVTTLSLNGVTLGRANYLTAERVYIWQLIGGATGNIVISSGTIDDATLSQRYGGWAFVPDMAWMNLQLFGFYQWKQDMAARGTVASASCAVPKPGLLTRLGQLLVPALHAAGLDAKVGPAMTNPAAGGPAAGVNPEANEDGCDDLHWLDGTMLRYCCDQHDKCYEKNGCSSSSWWTVWRSWSCDRCNMEVVFCFGTFVHEGLVI